MSIDKIKAHMMWAFLSLLYRARDCLLKLRFCVEKRSFNYRILFLTIKILLHFIWLVFALGNQEQFVYKLEYFLV